MDNSKALQEALEQFRKTFTKEQKAAIVSSMMIICGTPIGMAQIDGEFIEETANDLGIALDDPMVVSMPQKGRAGLALISNTLSKSNKEWFAHSLYILLSKTLTQLQPDPKKQQITLALLSDIGISDVELMRIVEIRSEALKSIMK